MRHFAAFIAFFAFLAISAHAQVALFTENFDGCVLPADWEIKSTGNQNPVWHPTLDLFSATTMPEGLTAGLGRIIFQSLERAKVQCFHGRLH